jgi:hypothetical protein
MRSGGVAYGTGGREISLGAKEPGRAVPCLISLSTFIFIMGACRLRLRSGAL